jgi:carboxylate-amine ligase
LTVERAAALAAYLQAICAMLMEREEEFTEEIYLVYNYNRFQACRFGLEGQVLDSTTGESTPLHIAVLQTLEACRPHARELEASAALDEIERWIRTDGNDARWQRETMQSRRSLAELVLESADRWRGRAAVAASGPLPTDD